MFYKLPSYYEYSDPSLEARHNLVPVHVSFEIKLFILNLS